MEPAGGNKVVKHFIDEVNELIPEQERDAVFDALKRYQSSLELDNLIEDLKKVLDEPQKLEIFDCIRPLIPPKHQLEYDKTAPPPPGRKSRIITLKRRNDESLGFALRGGFEHGVGVFISHVARGSQAEQQGLRVGDEIVRINGYTIAQAIHDEVLNLIKNRDVVELKVTNIGMLPQKENKQDAVTWSYVEMKKSKEAAKKEQAKRTSREHGQVIKVFANLRTSQTLGCSIASGPDGTGVFIANVKPQSLGQEIGLEVGDQILEVNGTSFLDIPREEAIVALKSSRELNITVQKGAGAVWMRVAGSQSRNSWPTKQNIASVNHEPKGSATTETVPSVKPPIVTKATIETRKRLYRKKNMVEDSDDDGQEMSFDMTGKTSGDDGDKNVQPQKEIKRESPKPSKSDEIRKEAPSPADDTEEVQESHEEIKARLTKLLMNKQAQQAKLNHEMENVLRGRGSPLKKPSYGLLGPVDASGSKGQTEERKMKTKHSPISDLGDLLNLCTLDTSSVKSAATSITILPDGVISPAFISNNPITFIS